MYKVLCYLLTLSEVIVISYGARILGVFPAPFFSHQAVFRSLTHELARRGHEVVVITTDPTPKDDLPANLTEIDVHDISYDLRDKASMKATGRAAELYQHIDKYYEIFGKLVELQTNTVEIQKLIKDKNQNFDLIFIEACVRPALIFSHIYKAPVITISSLGSIEVYTKYLGVPDHPILYPTCLYQKLNNLTLWEKATEIYNHYRLERAQETREADENAMLRRNFGEDVPTLSELKKNVAMLMINVHHVWEGHRPVPPNVVYLGGIHLETNYTKELSPEFKSYLDSSKHGVIYMSLGSLVVPSILINIDVVIKSFSKLQYDILLKWNEDYLAECPSNVKIIKWAPQKQLLHHPNVKLFITQGGMQSTDEAIIAGVPLIGIPVLGDQWYNADKYVQSKIGLRIDLEDVTEKKMLDAINTVIDDKSYKDNIIALRTLMYDQPQKPLERAIWWTEYILRHGNSLMPPAAHMTTWEYLEMNLLLTSLLCLVIMILITIYIGYRLFVIFKKNNKIKSH